jgi:hypothetical protein
MKRRPESHTNHVSAPGAYSAGAGRDMLQVIQEINHNNTSVPDDGLHISAESYNRMVINAERAAKDAASLRQSVAALDRDRQSLKAQLGDTQATLAQREKAVVAERNRADIAIGISRSRTMGKRLAAGSAAIATAVVATVVVWRIWPAAASPSSEVPASSATSQRSEASNSPTPSPLSPLTSTPVSCATSGVFVARLAAFPKDASDSEIASDMANISVRERALKVAGPPLHVSSFVETCAGIRAPTEALGFRYLYSGPFPTMGAANAFCGQMEWRTDVHWDCWARQATP